MTRICWTAGNRVPFDLSCGEHDSERVRRSNRRMAVLLNPQPAPVSLHVEPGQDHFQPPPRCAMAAIPGTGG